jgi:hypothetical protein
MATTTDQDLARSGRGPAIMDLVTWNRADHGLRSMIGAILSAAG